MSDISIFSDRPSDARDLKPQSKRFALIPGTDGELDPAAAGVIARLSRAGPRSEITAIEARIRYNESRKPLVLPTEAVESVSELRPATAGVPKLTIFRPAGSRPSEALPGLIFFHGGGWTLGDLTVYEPFVRSLANATQSAVIWVDYRLAPEYPFPAAIEDAWGASSWIQRNANWLGLDPARIGIGGDSAGANLAAVTALAARDAKVDFDPAYQMLLYPCLDLTAGLPSHQTFADGYLLTADLYAWYRRNYIGRGASAADWRVSPLFASSFADVAPAIILYAGFDPLRDEAAAYAARLKGAEVSVETLFFPGQIHGFLTMGGAIPAAGVAVARLGAAVKTFLGK